MRRRSTLVAWVMLVVSGAGWVVMFSLSVANGNVGRDPDQARTLPVGFAACTVVAP